MVRVYLFWVLLSLPGFALMNRVPRARAHVGDLGSISVAYLFSFLFLAPFSIAGYWFQLPLGLLSSAIVLVVLLAGIDLYFARRQWLPRLQRPDILFVSGAFVLLLFLVYSAVVGPSMIYDADFHLARIRFLYENGLSNADPYLGIEYTHVYHTNLYHAIICAGSRLSGIDILGFWYWTFAWAKLAAASAVYLLTYCIFRHRLSAWLSAFWFLGFTIFVTRSLYPNQIAPHWLVVTGLAFAVRALSERRPLFLLIAVGCTSFITGQVHSLYAGFLAISVTAAAIVFVIGAAIRDKKTNFLRNLWFAIAVAVAGCAAAPFVIIQKYDLFPKPPTRPELETKQTEVINPKKPNTVAASTPVLASVPIIKKKPAKWTKWFQYSDKGELVFPTNALFGGKLFQIIIVAVCLLVVLLSRDRKRFFVFLSIASFQTALLLVSPMASYAVSFLGEEWVLERMLDVMSVIFPVIAIGGLFSFRKRLPTFVTPTLLFSCAFLGIVFSGPTGRLANVQAAWETFRLNTTNLSNYNGLRKLQIKRRFLLKTIPRNSVLLADPGEGRKLAKLHGLRFIIVYRDNWVSDSSQRRRDIRRLGNPKIKSDLLKTLIDKYHIQYILRMSSEFPWAEKYATLVGRYDDMRIYRIN